MRKIGKIFYCIFIPLIVISCRLKETVHSSFVQIKKLNYPSASAIEYFDGKLYVMGDDATILLVLDTNLNVIDSIPVIPYPERRIPKDIKPDLEASVLKGDNIFLFGSGSLSPHRNFAWKHNLKDQESDGWTIYPPLSALQDNDGLKLDPLFQKIKEQGIEQLNIEGACILKGKLILVNRGNKSYPYNQLIIIDETFLKPDSSYQFSIIPFEHQKDTASFKGISGLCYSEKSDQLIMTVSTEDTRNSFDDGAIGKSYLWIINIISNKLNHKSIGPDKIIDLEEIDKGFKGYKIESVTVVSETNELFNLALVADNDDGSSTIFKMSIKKD